MLAIKEIKRVVGKQVTIEIPDNFHTEHVEIIAIPHRKKELLSTADHWEKDFLSVSQWQQSDETITVKSWPIQEY